MIFLLDLPKPIHGMANVNKAMLEEASNQFTNIKTINSAPSKFSHFFATKYWLFIKFLHFPYICVVLILNLFFANHKVVYRPINGGFGQVFDVFYILICRLFRVKIFIHHHSFNYLLHEKLLFKVLNSLIGKSATHIVLGERMRNQLVELYKVNRIKINIISNSTFFSDSAKIEEFVTTPKLIVGHLANLCNEKGLDSFIQICHLLTRNKIKFEGKIAGPFVNYQAELLVQEAVKENSQIKYLGPLYDTEKDLFFASLDSFVFPSKYKNEAEPLVLYEASQFGAYLCGSNVGCMGTVIDNLEGFQTEDIDNMEEKIAYKLIEGIENNIFSLDSRKKRRQLFKSLQTKSRTSLSNLLNEMESYELSKTEQV